MKEKKLARERKRERRKGIRKLKQNLNSNVMQTLLIGNFEIVYAT